MRKIFDAHIHCSELKDDYLIKFANANHLKYTLEELLGLMDEYDVYGGLLLSPPLTDGTPAPNQRIIDLCERSKGRLFPILTAEPSTKSVIECVALAKKHAGFVKGFKIRLGYVPAFPDDDVFSSLYDYAESKDLPVMFHTGDTATNDGSLKHAHPLGLDPVANKRPNLKIIICHFGNPWITDTAELIYKHENVYADISGMFVRGAKYSPAYLESLGRKLSEAIYYAGNADKVIFGTDYPVETYEDAVSLISKIKINTEDVERIVSKNARWVFSL